MFATRTKIRDLVAKTVARFGRLDIAVNNAGTEGEGGPITEQTAKSFGPPSIPTCLACCLSRKHEVLAMQGQGSGSIVNISSTYGHEAAAGASVYVGSKHAVEGINQVGGARGRQVGIRVNAVAPGPTVHGHVDPFYGHAAEQGGSG